MPYGYEPPPRYGAQPQGPFSRDVQRPMLPGGGTTQPTIPFMGNMAQGPQASSAAGAAAGGIGGALGGPLGWATLGTQVLGGLFGGMSGSANANRDRRFQANEGQRGRRLQERAMGSSEGDQMLAYQRSLENAPMRDRATYMMQARMGMTPGQFSPGDIFTPGSYGGINQNPLRQMNELYQPGMGGTQGSQDMMQQFIETLGNRAGSLTGTPYTAIPYPNAAERAAEGTPEYQPPQPAGPQFNLHMLGGMGGMRNRMLMNQALRNRRGG